MLTTPLSTMGHMLPNNIDVSFRIFFADAARFFVVKTKSAATKPRLIVEDVKMFVQVYH